MGIDYSALIAIGKVFGDEEEAKDFILQNAVQALGDLNIDAIDYSLADWIEDQEWEPDLYGGVLDQFSGRGFWVGYYITKRNFHNTEELVKKFEHVFNAVPDLIKEVLVF